MLGKQCSDEKDLPQIFTSSGFITAKGEAGAGHLMFPEAFSPPAQSICQDSVLLTVGAVGILHRVIYRGHTIPGSEHMKGRVDSQYWANISDEPQLLQRKEGNFDMMEG